MEDFFKIEEEAGRLVNWAWEFLPRIIGAVLTLVIGIWIIGILKRMLKRFFDKKDYEVTLETFFFSFISITLKVLLFVLVVTQLGVKSSSLIAILGSAGLAIGLALQGSLSNFAGGVLILVLKPFKVGDYIAAQGVDGTVTNITIFSTKLSTFGNQEVIVPNGQLSNGNITNYNAADTRRDNFKVGIGYSSDLKKAKEILLQICAENQNIMNEPAPEVYVEELAESSVNLTLRYWASNDVFWAAHFYVVEETKARFDAAGIEIPFPQRVVYGAAD
jgi:small conductance mechanosensitive channel